MTTALEGGEGSASRPGRSLPPEKTRYPSYRRLGGPQGRSGQVRKISPPPGFDPRTVQPVALPGPLKNEDLHLIWRNGLNVLVPLFRSVSLYMKGHLNVLDFYCAVLHYAFRNAQLDLMDVCVQL
jgi:hypothetical protein